MADNSVPCKVLSSLKHRRKFVKKRLSVSFISLATVLATSGVVKADYPPVEDVKPSTKSKDVSYDRTPGTVDPASRKIEAQLVRGGTRNIKVWVGEAFTPVITNLRSGLQFRVTLITPNGTVVQLPTVKVLENGRLNLPTTIITKVGVYLFKVTAPNGDVRTIRINAGK